VSEKQDDTQTTNASVGSTDPGVVPRKDAATAPAGQVEPAEPGPAEPASAEAEPEPKMQPEPAALAEAKAEPDMHPQPVELAETEAKPTQLRMRRAPRYLPFGSTGALIGVLAGVALALSFTAAANYSIQTIAGYFAAAFGLIGAVLGLGTAVLLERRRS
jgi:hypothetical protein